MRIGIVGIAVVSFAIGAIGCGANVRSPVDATAVPAEVGEDRCELGVAAEFAKDATTADLDDLLGPRAERYEVIRGPRIRIEGVARKARSASLMCGATEEFTVILKGAFQWPKEVLDQPVIVEGCLSRTYYPWEASHPDTSKWTARDKQAKNNVRALPFGFVYFLRDFTYELK